MPSFEKVTENLYVGSWPESLQQNIVFNVIINVSDEPCSSVSEIGVSSSTKQFWFPINECGKWEYSAFYAVKKVLDAYLNHDIETGIKILVHCRAGLCRSPIIVYSWLLSHGMEHLYPHGKEAWDLWQKSKRVPVALVEFLKEMNNPPNTSMVGVLARMKLPEIEKQWKEWEIIMYGQRYQDDFLI